MRFTLLLINLILCLAILSSCTSDGIRFITPTDEEQSHSTSATEPNSDTVRPDPTDIDAFVLNSTEQSALEEFANIRRQLGLPVPTTDLTLCALAYIRAQECYALVTHTRPNGQSYETIFEEYGYAVTGSGEAFICANAKKPMEEFFSVWTESPNISQHFSDPTFTKVGIAFYHKDNYYVMICLLAK